MAQIISTVVVILVTTIIMAYIIQWEHNTEAYQKGIGDTELVISMTGLYPKIKALRDMHFYSKAYRLNYYKGVIKSLSKYQDTHEIISEIKKLM